MNFYSFVCQWLKFIIEFAIAPNVWPRSLRPSSINSRQSFFSLCFGFSVTKRRFHLNVLLFYKYKLWPLNTFHTDDDTTVRAENWPKMIFYGARERSTRDTHTILCAIHRFTWTTIGVSIKYIYFVFFFFFQIKPRIGARIKTNGENNNAFCIINERN